WNGEGRPPPLPAQCQWIAGMLGEAGQLRARDAGHADVDGRPGLALVVARVQIAAALHGVDAIRRLAVDDDRFRKLVVCALQTALEPIPAPPAVLRPNDDGLGAGGSTPLVR